jgi:UDP-glucuronate decarboxylase
MRHTITAKHILLTGGTGFFGKALLRHWAELDQQGHAIPQVTVLSRNPSRFAAQCPALCTHSWLGLVQGDICDSESLPRGTAFTHVLHAATDSTEGTKLTPQQRFDQIVNGTRNILDLAVGTGAPRILLTSSGGVYGPQPPEMERIDENFLGMPDPLDPNNSYSVAKRCAEHLCAIYERQHGIRIIIARCFAFVGQDLPLDKHFAIGNFIRDALYAPEITVTGDGSAIRSYMDQRDLARWLCVLLEQGESGQAYNVGSDQAITIGELAGLTRDLISPSKIVRIANSLNANNFRNRYVPSTSKASRDLELSLKFSLEEAILEAALHQPHRKP